METVRALLGVNVTAGLRSFIASSLQNGQSAVLLCAMAEYDLRSNSSTFQTNVTTALVTLANNDDYDFTRLQYGESVLLL